MNLVIECNIKSFSNFSDMEWITGPDQNEVDIGMRIVTLS